MNIGIALSANALTKKTKVKFMSAALNATSASIPPATLGSTPAEAQASGLAQMPTAGLTPAQIVVRQKALDEAQAEAVARNEPAAQAADDLINHVSGNDPFVFAGENANARAVAARHRAIVNAHIDAAYQRAAINSKINANATNSTSPPSTTPSVGAPVPIAKDLQTNP